MAPVPPNGVGKLVIDHLFSDSPWVNTFHVLSPGAVTIDEIDALAADILDIWISNLQPYLTSQDRLQGAHLYMSDGSTITEGTATADEPGLDGDPILPSGTACVISWTGAWHYRGGKPRTYLSGLTQPRLVGPHTFSGSFLGDLAGSAADFMNGISSLSGTYGSASLGVLLGAGPSAAGTFAPFTGVKVNPSVCSQRRRNNST